MPVPPRLCAAQSRVGHGVRSYRGPDSEPHPCANCDTLACTTPTHHTSGDIVTDTGDVESGFRADRSADGESDVGTYGPSLSRRD
jgi:hypothetical protein